MGNFKLCKIENCGRQSAALGFCSMHYRRHRKGSDLLRPSKGTLQFCIVEGCNRPVLASGLCNAHYIRKRNGKSLAPKIWERKIVCIECGSKINHGGQGRCQLHYTRYKRIERGKELARLLGGKCEICKKEYPTEVYDFHHKHPKKKIFSISSKITDSPMQTLIEEAKKCMLLCANCHRTLHFGKGATQ